MKFNKKAVAPLLILLAILSGIGALVTLGIMDLPAMLGGTSTDLIYKARLGRLECIKDQSPELVLKYADQNYEFECGKNYLVDNCDIIVTCEDSGFWATACSGSYLKNGQAITYNVPAGQTKSIGILSQGDTAKLFNSRGTFYANFNEDKTKIEYTFYPYRLYTIEGGKFLSNSADCCLSNQNELERQQFDYGDWECLEKKGTKQWKNYQIDWIQVEGEIYSYNGQEVICANNILYELDRVKKANDKTYNFQGNIIKAVDCCPYQTKYCNSKTFEFIEKEEAEQSTCTYDYQCENLGNPWTATRTTGIQERCVNGVCTETEFNIECRSDADCRSLKGEGWGCDLRYSNFGKCIQIGLIPQPRCGDGFCQTGETKDNCPEDCSIVCPEGWKLVTTEKKINCLVGFPLYWGCDTSIEKECVEEGTDWKYWFTLIGIIIFILVALYFLFPVLRVILIKFGIKI